MNFLIMIDIFSIFLLELEIYCQDEFQNLGLLTNHISFTNRLLYFWKKTASSDQKQQQTKKEIEFYDLLNNSEKMNINS